MLKKILIAVGALVLAFMTYVALLPPDLRIARSTAIAAPPQAVFAHINDFHKWQDWSPWAKLDPNAKATFEGPSSGKDAVFKWSGNHEVGAGKMTIVESRPGEVVRIKLDFTEPKENTAAVVFDLKAEGDKTSVIWSMDSKNTFVQRAMCVIFNGEAMLGRQYEQGLANLKNIVEKGS